MENGGHDGCLSGLATRHLLRDLSWFHFIQEVDVKIELKGGVTDSTGSNFA
jgi:hypothetical protein